MAGNFSAADGTANTISFSMKGSKSAYQVTYKKLDDADK